MKKFWIGLWVICAGMCVAACSEEDAPMAVMPDDAGTFVDVRDGNEYHYLRYGNQEWTCENARYIISNIDMCTIYQPIDWEWGSGTFDDFDTRYYDRFGCLYSLEGALQAVPDGWRLPTDEDWQELERHFGMSAGDAAALDWRGNIAPLLKEQSDDYSTMDILMGGYYTDYTSGGRLGWRFMSVYAYYWTATQDSGKGDGYYFARKFGYNQNGIWRHSMEKDHYQLSVRFVRDVE